MTNDELAIYYANLLILQYREKPKAYANVKMLALQAVADQLPLAVQDAFDLSTAVGDQLDVLGKYADLGRIVNTASFGSVVLNDTQYRSLLQMKFALNSAGSSLKDIQQILFDFFPGVILVHDYATMRLSYTFDESFGPQVLAEAFAGLNLFPKPTGVQLSSIVYITPINNIFGFRTAFQASNRAKGFNTIAEYNADWHWLTRADGFPTV